MYIHIQISKQLCFQGLIILFRKIFRQSIDNFTFGKYTMLQRLHSSNNIKTVWKEIKYKTSRKVAYKLNPNDFKDF